MDALFQALGARVKERRAGLGLSQAELAEQLGLTRTSISNIEAGRQRLPLVVLYRLAACLNCLPHDLLPSPSELPRSDAVVSALAAKTDRADLRDFLSVIGRDLANRS